MRRFVLSRDPLNLDESINAALIEEQNMKLNQITNEERSGLSPAQTENLVRSALTDRLEKINLRVGRLQEAQLQLQLQLVNQGGILLTEGRTFSNAFIVAFKDIDKRSVEKRRGTNALPITSPPGETPLAIFLFHVTPVSMGDMSISENQLFTIITQPPGIRLADFVRDVKTPIKLQASCTSHGLLHTTTRQMNCYAVSTRLRRYGHHLWMYPLAPWAEPLQDSNSTGLLQDQ
ncbi:hypothetical protein TNCV_2613131 [Trichonephila clavipes]|nr:hypothetical protein TNCV_2613131 [Trichonephila clavipes]